MPLPTDSKTVWPPASAVAGDLAQWGAWYSGSNYDLITGVENATKNGGLSSYVRGLWRRREKAGQGGSPASTAEPLHVPLAAEIAAVSADLLFGDFPALSVEHEATQARLEDLIELGDLHSVMLEAGEGAAALGGVFLRATWDKGLADHPFLTVMHADQAVPEFRYGRLTAVTFWRQIQKDGRTVYRHLERYEAGHILHGLYAGTEATLGKRIDLSFLPDTEALAEDVALPEALAGGLAAWYLPNVRPNRRNRQSPHGRADIAGSESELDALDETYTSWMRDIRLGQARIIVPESALEPAGRGRGKGKVLNLDREVFTTLEVDPTKVGITEVQFAIRTAEHRDTARELTERVVSGAGYSPQTFGLAIAGSAESGTALRIREGRTFQTLARKQRYAAGALRPAIHGLLAIDAAEFGSGAKAELPKLEWPEERQTVNELAVTADLLRRAEAASTWTLVKMTHPELTDEQVTEEVARIQQESGSVMPDPLQQGSLA